MDFPHLRQCIAFNGFDRVAEGALGVVAVKLKQLADDSSDAVLRFAVFDSRTSEPIEIDLRGSADDVLHRLDPPPAEAAAVAAAAAAAAEPTGPRGTGRPRLGVVAREVTLLPRHWDWLARQPGGASVTLRRVVDEARRVHAGADRVRTAQEISYRFMLAMAGDLPAFEEAARSLFAGDADRFEAATASWPDAVRSHARGLAAAAFAG